MQPLQGVTILDLTRLLPGPYAAWLLRSWGARVIKVEDPGQGDYLREMEPRWFAHLNAGAESLVLDLKAPGGREAFLRLATRAEMVLEGFRPGVMERLGLDYPTLAARNPRLVLVSLTGYGSGGELAHRAGHDLNYLARSGLVSLMAESPPVPLADLTSGMLAAAAGLAALVGARQSGRGTRVEVSLLDAAYALGSLLAVDTLAGHPPDRTTMPLAGGLPCYEIYETADGGRVTLAALEPKFWQSFVAAAGRPDLAGRQFDPGVRSELADLFRSRTRAEWADLARRVNDACLEPVLTMAEAAAERSRLQPARFAGERPQAAGPAPERGAHTRSVLQEAGFTPQELADLAAAGVIPRAAG